MTHFEVNFNCSVIYIAEGNKLRIFEREGGETGLKISEKKIHRFENPYLYNFKRLTDKEGTLAVFFKAVIDLYRVSNDGNFEVTKYASIKTREGDFDDIFCDNDMSIFLTVSSNDSVQFWHHERADKILLF